jgi:hypothetical protein
MKRVSADGTIVGNGVRLWPDGTVLWGWDWTDRRGGPALITARGSHAWWRQGKYHREEGPAVLGVRGTREWHRDGRRVAPGRAP